MDSRKSTTKRRRLQLSLRAFFLFFTLTCLLLGWIVQPAMRQREAVEYIRNGGGGVTYDYMDFQNNIFFNKSTGQLRGPAWLRNVVSDDFFADVIHVNCRDTQIKSIAVLSKLPQLQQLNLNESGVSDLSPLAQLTNIHTLECRGTNIRTVGPLAGLVELRYLQLSGTELADVTPLSELTSLEQLYLSDTKVTDVSPLANIKSLQFLGLRGTPVRDVMELALLPNLKYLDLRDTQVTHERVQSLRRVLPMCNIEYDGVANE